MPTYLQFCDIRCFTPNDRQQHATQLRSPRMECFVVNPFIMGPGIGVAIDWLEYFATHRARVKRGRKREETVAYSAWKKALVL